MSALCFLSEHQLLVGRNRFSVSESSISMGGGLSFVDLEKPERRALSLSQPGVVAVGVLDDGARALVVGPLNTLEVHSHPLPTRSCTPHALAPAG